MYMSPQQRQRRDLYIGSPARSLRLVLSATVLVSGAPVRHDARMSSNVQAHGNLHFVHTKAWRMQSPACANDSLRPRTDDDGRGGNAIRVADLEARCMQPRMGCCARALRMPAMYLTLDCL